MFCFTVEDLAADPTQTTFKLNYTGRFSHTELYVRQSLEAAGLQCLSLQKVILRKEAGEPVTGQLVVARLRGDAL